MHSYRINAPAIKQRRGFVRESLQAGLQLKVKIGTATLIKKAACGFFEPQAAFVRFIRRSFGSGGPVGLEAEALVNLVGVERVALHEARDEVRYLGAARVDDLAGALHLRVDDVARGVLDAV